MTNLSEKLNFVRFHSNDVHVEHLRCVFVLANTNERSHAPNRKFKGLPSVKLLYWRFLLFISAV